MNTWNVEVPAAADGDVKIGSTTLAVQAHCCAADGDLTFWNVVNGSEVTVRVFARRTWLSCTLVTA